MEIFRRLLVGSEGTLGFISEAVFETVPHGRHVRTGLLFFPSIDAASAPVPALVEAGATAVELMVNATLIAASYSLPGIPEEWRDVPPDGAVLLVELRTDDPSQLDGMEQRALAAVEGHELLEAAAFTGVPEEIEVFWLVREGMQGIVGAMRPQGTSLIIEDVCVRPERIAECARDVQALLGKHEFLTGVAGHASAGNLHFLLTPALGEPADRDRYEAFMGELVELIVGKYDGSLKAEHGTGRNMAPYVEREWGEKATELMWRVKRLADPDGVLNPGAVLSDDPGIHLAGPQVHARDRGRLERERVHRVRLLRAGLPSPRRDHHAAPADRAAPRDGAPARGLAGAGRAGARLRRTTGSTPAPPTARASSCARSGSTPGSW